MTVDVEAKVPESLENATEIIDLIKGVFRGLEETGFTPPEFNLWYANDKHTALSRIQFYKVMKQPLESSEAS